MALCINSIHKLDKVTGVLSISMPETIVNFVLKACKKRPLYITSTIDDLVMVDSHRNLYI